MSFDYSVSMNGIGAAERNFSLASKRVAGDNFSEPADMIQISQSKNTIEANLKVISTQMELDCESLDLFA
jgi:hypothetical protein